MQRPHCALLVSLIVGSAACAALAPVGPAGGGPAASGSVEPEAQAPSSQPQGATGSPGSGADAGVTAPSAAGAAAPGAPSNAPPAAKVPARYYVRVSKDIKHATGRPAAEIEALVLTAIKSKVPATGEIELRTPEQPVGKTQLDKRAMRLTAIIEPLTFAKGDWQVSVVLRVERHSDGALLGEIKKKVLIAGSEKQSKAREDAIISTALEAAAQDFVGRCAAFEEASFKKGAKK